MRPVGYYLTKKRNLGHTISLWLNLLGFVLLTFTYLTPFIHHRTPVTSSYQLRSVHVSMSSNPSGETHVQESRVSTPVRGECSIYVGAVDDTVARKLKDKVLVLIWVMTAPSTLKTRGQAVKDTWAKRCNKVLFFSSEADPSFPAIGLNVSEGRDHLTAKSSKAWKYIYQHHMNDADWFMKTDDDSYVILENLRFFLSNRNSSEPVIFGHMFRRPGDNVTYYSGGSGYVMSKESLKRLNERGYPEKICEEDGEFEDLRMSVCMARLGVKLEKTTDDQTRNRFNCLSIFAHLVGLYPQWYIDYDINGAKKGEESISDYAISFHYATPEVMYSIDFTLYHLQTFGIIHSSPNLSTR
ncbi:Glycoprotein-N-acetylgalactosamine 3-beta-galactosyltransferase 1 [Bulinus truncatus]|nr:Glycoprotein-N-acetylgalactosamine 3-beta-galactosyltransferase 1 [Bulinus truncatus]